MFAIALLLVHGVCDEINKRIRLSYVSSYSEIGLDILLTCYGVRRKMQCSYDIEFVQRLLYSGSCLWCLCTSECRYGMFVCTWTWQGDLLRGTWWHWWCAPQLSAYTVQIYEHYSTTLLIYLFISNFISYLKFASKMFIYSVKTMMTRFPWKTLCNDCHVILCNSWYCQPISRKRQGFINWCLWIFISIINNVC